MTERVASWWGIPEVQFAVTIALAIVLGLLVHALLKLVVQRTMPQTSFARAILRSVEAPARVLLPLLAVSAVLAHAELEAAWLAGAVQCASLLVIAAFTWLAIRLVAGIAGGIAARHPADVVDNLDARRILTQTRVLSRTAMFLIGVVGLAAMLMTFPGIRQIGASLLASAGLAGLVAGLAARPVLSNMLAGLQIAIAQPIRIDDVLIVEGEWGRVEEITGTYVVVRIWDERRLVVPLQYFIEKPFQNWTRSSSSLIGTVYLWVDYRLPLAPLRAELERLCRGSDKWDQRVVVLQVTDANERAMQLRALVSSANSGNNWDLRCLVREGLIAFIGREHPDALPRLRAEALLAHDGAPDGASGEGEQGPVA